MAVAGCGSGGRGRVAGLLGVSTGVSGLAWQRRTGSGPLWWSGRRGEQSSPGRGSSRVERRSVRVTQAATLIIYRRAMAVVGLG
jgi:hypothetical protein